MKKITVTYHMQDLQTEIETCIELPISKWRYNMLRLNEFSIDEDIILLRNDIIKDIEIILEHVSRIQSHKFSHICQIDYN